MLTQAIILSLQITAIYILFMQGMLLGKVRIKAANWLDNNFLKANSKVIQKPLWDCPACMSSVWTIILTQSIDIPLMLCVCTISFIISKMIEE
jgi:hypothetical protein